MKKIIWALLFLPQITLAQYNSKLFTLNAESDANTICVEKSFITDTTLVLNIASPLSELVISGNAKLKDENSYIRVVLRDKHNYDYLVYENYLLLSDSLSCDFERTGIETLFLENIIPQYLMIELRDATLNVDLISYTPMRMSNKHPNKVKEQNQFIVDKLNRNLKKYNKTWVAGVTSVSEKSYEDKKAIFGGSVPALFGFDYYVGGVFIIDNSQYSKQKENTAINRISSQFVSEWDWRDRHGKNWITPVRYQGNCGSCWAHAAIGALESYVNLYYNDTINLDLSEQELVSCSTNNGCGGGNARDAMFYFKNNGIVNEDCFQYTASEINCNYKCTNPNERIFIDDYTYINNNESDIKQQLFKSPLAFSISSWRHAMTLVGYTTIQIGDTIYDGNSNNIDTIIVNNDNYEELKDKTVWIFKNSWGENWGDNGYAYCIVNINNTRNQCAVNGRISSLIYTDSDIKCEDSDGDGYYFWGIGTKPSTCPSWIPDIPDGDDSNYQYGPMDAYGNLEDLSLRALYTIHISRDFTYLVNNFIYNDICVCSSSSLTIQSTINMYGNTNIKVEPNGVLIIDGGHLINADLNLYAGSKLIVKNGGTITMRSGKEFFAPLGAVVEIEEGMIE